jgi:hypothetical protein
VKSTSVLERKEMTLLACFVLVTSKRSRLSAFSFSIIIAFRAALNGSDAGWARRGVGMSSSETSVEEGLWRRMRRRRRRSEEAGALY